jgi:hypothetical protein
MTEELQAVSSAIDTVASSITFMASEICFIERPTVREAFSITAVLGTSPTPEPVRVDVAVSSARLERSIVRIASLILCVAFSMVSMYIIFEDLIEKLGSDMSKQIKFVQATPISHSIFTLKLNNAGCKASDACVN